MDTLDDSAFPADALPGEVHCGPDGRRYRLAWDEQWHFCSPEPRDREDEGEDSAATAKTADPPPPPPPIAHLPATLPPPPPLPECPLPPSAWLHGGGGDGEDGDDGSVALYPEEYAAVIAEAAGHRRADGWTAERRVLFLDRLSECGSVRLAARAAGITRQAVHKLRLRAPAFDAAYRDVLRVGVTLLAESAFDRAIHGSEVPVFHKGRQVGTRVRHHDRLLEYLLRVRDPLNFAPVDELDRWHRHRTVDAPSTAPGSDCETTPSAGQLGQLPPRDRGAPRGP